MSVADTISTDHAFENRIYTQEENYRAYKLFSMMDVDSGGSISLRELYRVLMGDAIRYVSCDFDHPDSGIVWGLDEEACVAVMDIEEASLALNFPFLIKRMRLHSINGVIITQHDPKALEEVYQMLLKLHDDPVTFEFIEPIIVVNKFSCVLDLEVDNRVYSITLPVGGVYNLDIFRKRLCKEMTKVHHSLKFLKVGFIPRKRQIFFKSSKFNFKLLFLTGPNNRRSCRYALGFSAEDTSLANYHIGQPMLIDLNLGLDRAKTEILMEELFSKFDSDGSGEFEFEEFRDFYIRYLDTDESLEYLRKYAKHRFRDIEHERMVRKERLERENRARRRAYLKIKYHDLVEAQKAKFRNNSHVDMYGNRRRTYKHRPGFVPRKGRKPPAGQAENTEDADLSPPESPEKQPTSPSRERTPVEQKRKIKDTSAYQYTHTFDPTAEGEEAFIQRGLAEEGFGAETLGFGASSDDGDSDTRESRSFGGSPVLHHKHKAKLPPLEPSQRKASLDSVHSAHSVISAAHSAVTDPTVVEPPATMLTSANTSTSGFISNKALRHSVKHGLLSHEEAAKIRQETAQKRKQDKEMRHAQRRKQILKIMLEANKTLNRAHKADAKKFKDSHLNMDMMEAHCVIKKAVLKSFRMKNTDFEAVQSIKWDVSHAVCSPALVIDSAILGLAINLDNVDLQELDSKLMHPAAQKYFFLREIKLKNPPFGNVNGYKNEYNAKVCHPVYFSSHYERQPSRHSKIALSLAKIVTYERAVGEQYRAERGLKRVYAVPEFDLVPSKVTRKEKVRFLIDYKDPIKPDTVVARLTVVSIRVSKLPSIHIVEENSPFVSLHCGQWRFTTEINSFAGSESMWDDLSWLFRLHHADELIFTVHSGTAVSSKVIGSYTIPATTLTALPLVDNHIRIAANICDNGVVCGNIEVVCYAELGNEWDWHVTQYKREQDRLHVKHSTIKKFSRTMPASYTTSTAATSISGVTFPLPIQITDLCLFDLKSMHFLKYNRPYVRLSCGTTEECTSMLDNIQDTCTWDVCWDVNLVSENANLIFIVHSETLYMGRFIISGDELIRLQRSRANYVDVHGDIMNNSQFVGKIKFKCKLKFGGATISTTQDTTQHSEDTQVNAEDESGLHNAAPHSPHTALVTDYSPNIVLPAVVTVHFIELYELPVGKGKSHSPQVMLTCGYWSSSSPPQQLDKALRCSWADQPGWTFPIDQKLHFEVKIFLGFQDLGVLVLRAAELVSLPRDSHGRQYITKDIHNGIDVCGKIRLVLSYTLEGQSYTVGRQLEKLQKAAYREPHIAGYGDLPLSNTIATYNDTVQSASVYNNVGGSIVLEDSKGVAQNTYPFRMCVTDIIANDLKAAHMLVKNSPSIRLVCGLVSTTTKEIPRAGASAIWSGLQCIVFIHANTSVRVSVFSKTTCIGYHTLEDTQILDCTPDISGNRELYCTIHDDHNKTGGKVKLTYTLESVPSYTAPPPPFDTSTIRKGLEPPLLVTIHTVSLMNLRSVHRFGHNSPFVKVSCGAWKGATLSQDYAGKNAKWRDMSWTFVIHAKELIRMVVQSGTIIVGKKNMSVDDVLSQNPNNQGLCEWTGQLMDSEGRTYEAGQIRITFSYEAHIGEVEVYSSDSDSDESYSGSVNHANTHPPGAHTMESVQDTSLLHSGSVTKKSIGHIHLLSIVLTNIAAVHALTANSPFLKIRCDDFRAVTTTQYSAGDHATWSDLTISFGISRASTIDIALVSGTTHIGTLNTTVKHILSLPVDTHGHVVLSGVFFMNGEMRAECTITLHVDRLNRMGFGNATSITQERFNATTSAAEVDTTNHANHKLNALMQGEASLDLDAKSYQSHDISRSPVTVPFVLRVVRVLVLDMVPELAHHFASGVAVLSVRLDSWAKTTPCSITSTHGTQCMAEWADVDWVYIVTNAQHALVLTVLSGMCIIGELTLTLGDIVSTPPSHRGLIEMPLYLFRGTVPCGKVKVCMTIAPYVSPEVALREEIQSRAQTPHTARTVGHLRIKTIRVFDLHQVYGLFLNSPRVTLSFGRWHGTTTVAVDAGTEYTWDNISFGRIPIQEGTTLIAKVSSGNEPLGTFTITAFNLLAAVVGDEGTMLIQGDVLDGAIVKGRLEIECLPVRILDEDGPDVESSVYMDANGVGGVTGGPSGDLADVGVGAGLSWISNDHHSVQHATHTPHVDKHIGAYIVTPRTPHLSTATPTPDLTTVTFVGVSVFDLKAYSAIFRNSPYVVLSCETWQNDTSVAKFAGASANWILKRNASWQVTMRAAAFLTIQVFTDHTLLGSVCVNVRELIEVPRDSQGLTMLTRDLEHDSNITGKVSIVLNLAFKTVAEADAIRSGDAAMAAREASLQSLSIGVPPLYPVHKQSISNSVIKTGLRGALQPDMVATNYTLELPINMHILGASVSDVAKSLIASANELSIVVKCDDALLRTPVCTNATKHVSWELGWDLPVLSTVPIVVTLHSALGYVGEVHITTAELLSAPRTSQGYTELTRSLRALSGVSGKLHLSLLLTPFLSPEQKELYAKQADETLQAQLTSLRTLATLDVELVSVIDISPLYGTLSLCMSIGEYRVTDIKTSNHGGAAVWGSQALTTKNVPLLERSHVLLNVSSDGAVLGNMLLTCADILTAPVDSAGLAVVYGTLQDGLTYQGKMSLTCRITLPNTDKTQHTPALHSTQIDAQGSLLELPAELPPKAEDITCVVIQAISAKNLKPVHKVGKNSPMCKIEVKGLKFQSNALPYAGNKAEWTDLLWKMDLLPVAKVKLSLTSGSAVIGTAMFSTQLMLDKLLENTNGVNDAFVKLDLVKNSDYMGTVTVVLRSERSVPSKELQVSDSILLRPENLYHIPSVVDPHTLVDTTQTLHIGIGEASVDDIMMTPPKMDMYALGDNIHKFRAHQTAADDMSLMSMRSAQSQYTDHTQDSEIGSQGGHSVATASQRSALLSVPEGQLLPPLPLTDALPSEPNTARSQASNASGVSVNFKASGASGVSRPRTSRGEDPGPQSARSVGSQPSLPSVSDSSYTDSYAGSQYSGTQQDSRSAASFSVDSVGSSYVYHSDMIDHRERTIHTIPEGSEAESYRSYDSRSGDSSTAFDSSGSQSTLGYSQDRSLERSQERSIYSESNSLTSSAYLQSIDDSYSVNSDMTSVFGTDRDPRGSPLQGSLASRSLASQSRDSQSAMSQSVLSQSVASQSVMTPSVASQSLMSRSLVSKSVASQSVGQSVDYSVQDSRTQDSGTPHLHSQDTRTRGSQSPESRSFDHQSTDGSRSFLSDPHSESYKVSVGASQDSPSAYTRSERPDDYSDYSGSVESKASSFRPAASKASSHTTSFLARSARSAPSSAGPPPVSTVKQLHGVAQNRSVLAGQPPVVPHLTAWDEDASTIATKESSHAYEQGHSVGQSVGQSVGRSDGSSVITHDTPSLQAHSIYSGHTINIAADAEQFSDYSRSSGYYTSRSGTESEITDYTYDSHGTPRSEFSDYSSASGSASGSEYSEDYSEHSGYSRLSNRGAPVGAAIGAAGGAGGAGGGAGGAKAPSQLKSILRVPSIPLGNNKSGKVETRPATVADGIAGRSGGGIPLARNYNHIQFDISKLRWLPPDAPLTAAATFVSEQFVSHVLSSAVRSFVAVATGGDFNAAARLPPLSFTYNTTRQRTVRNVAFKVARWLVQTAGSTILRRHAATLDTALALPPVPTATKSATSEGDGQASARSVRNPYLDGTFKKRAGITLTTADLNSSSLQIGGDSDDETTTGGGLRRKGQPDMPQKVRITFHDVLGIDLGFIDPRVLPKRPYLTVCKPYGNWAAETNPAWTSLDHLTPADLVLNWYDLSNKLRWERFVLRLGQFLVFDLHDAGSGLLFAKAVLPYENILNKHLATKTDIVTVFIEFNIANEYGGGKMGGVARMHLDLSVNVFVRTKKPVEFWDTHRSEHWTNFPIAPISTGKVRQKYREIASDYDSQSLVHPSLFGFRVRWRGNPEDESRFIHPMFKGFTLTKKPVPKKLTSELGKNMQKDAKPNPWRWDATAAALGRCPVCADGVSGCPRCFMLPMHKDGFPSTAEEFAYNPDLERQKARVAEQKAVAAAAKRTRRLARMKLSAVTGEFEEGSLGSMSEEHASDGEDEHSVFTMEGPQFENSAEKGMTLHTNLTTYKSLRAYRNCVQKLMTVYVKLIPTGYVRKFVVDSTDTIFHMYNMYHSHSNFGTAHSSMLLIPTIVGMFELHKELETESDLLMAIKRGRDTLGDYGLHERSSTIVMLFVPNYKPEYVPIYLSTFFEKNTDFNLHKLPMYDSIERLPASLAGDVVQRYLKGLIETEYAKQQTDLLREFVQRGLTYHQSRDFAAATNLKKHLESSKERLKERNAMQLRMESQLKGLTGAERKAAKKALKKRELNKKRSVLYDVEKAALDDQRSADALNTRRNKSAGTEGRGLSRGSTGLSLSDIELRGEGPESSRSGSGSEKTGSEDSSTDDSSAWESGTDASDTSDTDSSDSSDSSSTGSEDSDGSGDDQRQPEEPAAEMPLSPRNRQSSNSQEERLDSARRFFVVDDGASQNQSDTMYTSQSQSHDSDTMQTGRSQLSNLTGLSSSLYNSSVSHDSSATRFYDDNTSAGTFSTYGTHSDTDTGRSSQSGSTYSDGSYTSRSGSSGSYTSRSGSSYTGSYSSEGSDYTASSGYSNYTASTYSSQSTSQGSYSTSQQSSLPHHQGSSLHSLYSGMSEPLSVHSAQISHVSVTRSVTTLYSGIPLPPPIPEGDESARSSRSGSSYSSYSHSTDGSYSSYTSGPSSRGSESTGGLFTYRSALDSLPSSRTSVSGYSDSPRSQSSAYDSEGRSEYTGSARSHSRGSSASSRSSEYYSANESWGSRPSSAGSTASALTYSSALTGSEMHGDSASQSLEPSIAPSQAQSSQARSSSQSKQSGNKGSLFSGDMPSSTASYTASQDTGTYTTGSRSQGSYTRSDSDSSGSLNLSDSNTASYIEDISIYSKDFHSADEESTRDDISEYSQQSADTSVHSLFSESGSANTYPTVPKLHGNQRPIPTVRFEPSADSLRSRFEKVKQAREALHQPAVAVDAHGNQWPVKHYADGSPITKRAATVPGTKAGNDDVSVSSSVDGRSCFSASRDSRTVSSGNSRSLASQSVTSQSMSQSLASYSRSIDFSDYSVTESTYTPEREKRRVMQYQKELLDRSRIQYDDASEVTLDSGRLDSSRTDSLGSEGDSTTYTSYTGSSAHTGSYTSRGNSVRSVHTAESVTSALTASTAAGTGTEAPTGHAAAGHYRGSQPSRFVQKTRDHLQRASSFEVSPRSDDLSDPRGSHIMSEGTGNDSSDYNSESNSLFFTVSEDSASIGHDHGAHAYSSDNQSAYTSSTHMSSNNDTGSGSGWGEECVSRPRAVPPLRYDDSDSSMHSYGSTSSGTVDYIYRSDVLSDGSSKSGGDSQSSYDSWEPNNRRKRK